MVDDVKTSLLVQQDLSLLETILNYMVWVTTCTHDDYSYPAIVLYI